MDCSLYIIGFRPLLSNVPSLTEYLHFLIFLENGKKKMEFSYILTPQTTESA